MNLIFISVLSSWLISQIIKVFSARNKKVFFRCGGMPSSHSAFVGALSTAVGILEGFSSTVFLVSVAFSIIVVHDAVQIRKQHAVKEAIVGICIGIVITLIINRFF